MAMLTDKLAFIHSSIYEGAVAPAYTVSVCASVCIRSYLGNGKLLILKIIEFKIIFEDYMINASLFNFL